MFKRKNWPCRSEKSDLQGLFCYMKIERKPWFYAIFHTLIKHKFYLVFQRPQRKTNEHWKSGRMWDLPFWRMRKVVPQHQDIHAVAWFVFKRNKAPAVCSDTGRRGLVFAVTKEMAWEERRWKRKKVYGNALCWACFWLSKWNSNRASGKRLTESGK